MTFYKYAKQNSYKNNDLAEEGRRGNDVCYGRG